MKNNKIIKFALLSLVILALSGCKLNPKNPENPIDPYESYNRKVFKFNQDMDKAIIKPIAKFYNAVLPWPIRKGLGNFFNNINDMTTIPNDFLQFKLMQGYSDIWRVAVNTTFGIGGLFDVASHIGLERHIEDFGLTLAHWGDKESPYLVLPFFGPSTIRDHFAMVYDYTVFNPYFYANNIFLSAPVSGTQFIHRRAELESADNLIESVSVDPYTFQRDAYLQRRAYLMNPHAATTESEDSATSEDDNDPYVDELPEEKEDAEKKEETFDSATQETATS